MDMRTDTFLSVVDRISRSVGPVNNLVAHIVDRMAPQTIARADVCPPPGTIICEVYCAADDICCGPSTKQNKMIVYAPMTGTCAAPTGVCAAGCSPGCPNC